MPVEKDRWSPKRVGESLDAAAMRDCSKVMLGVATLWKLGLPKGRGRLLSLKG